MSPLLLLLVTISTAACATPTFDLDEDINWLVDMRKEYPIGFVCSKLFVVQVNGRSAKRLSEHKPRDTPGNYASEEAFLGNRFMVTIPAVALMNGNHVLRLDCEPKPNAKPVPLATSAQFSIKGNNHNSPSSHSFEHWHEDKPVSSSSDSEPGANPRFSIKANNRIFPSPNSFEYWLKDTPVPPSAGHQIILRDISPTALNEDSRWSCPISFDLAKEPVLVNNLILDSGNFAKYLTSKQENGGEMVDVYNRPIDSVHLVNPAAMKHRENILKQQQQEEEAHHSEIPAVDLESIEAENKKLLETVNLNTDAVDSQALPILKELWSAKAVEDQLTAATRDINRDFRRKILRGMLSQAAAFLTGFAIGYSKNSAVVAYIHYFGPTPVMRFLPRYTQFIRSSNTIFGWFLQNAESDKTLLEKLTATLKLSVCTGLPIYAALAAISYVKYSSKLRLEKAEVEAKEHRRIKLASMKHLMAPIS